MRTPFQKTMLYSDLNAFQQWWRKWQLQAFTAISSNSAFIGCQYFTVRGLRTLNGKIVQHQLSRFYTEHPDKENSPIPSKISYYHFIDEFCQRGGIVEASPSCISKQVSSIGVLFQLEPDGEVEIQTTFEKLGVAPFNTCGFKFPQSSLPNLNVSDI